MGGNLLQNFGRFVHYSCMVSPPGLHFFTPFVTSTRFHVRNLRADFVSKAPVEVLAAAKVVDANYRENPENSKLKVQTKAAIQEHTELQNCGSEGAEAVKGKQMQSVDLAVCASFTYISITVINCFIYQPLCTMNASVKLC